ncbi:transposase [Treponema sp. UBA753]|uniref:transposase n=1 Tax=Treponema sp. UBA753 TaxID=1947747 RepID=UPI0025CE63C9|nr:transposase [Treponema sp. UBA753]
MRYSKEFKEQAIKLSDEIGVNPACAQLGLVYATLADWRKSYNRERILKQKTSEDDPPTEREKKLMKENADLREANNILKDAFRFFVNDRKQ